MDGFCVLNRLPFLARIPLKTILLALTALLVCFPYPALLLRHIERLRDPNALIDPEAEGIREMVDEIRPRLTADMPPAQALKEVERYVYRRVPYAWDWDNWGMADYLPTVEEVLERGREDCDGQAVVGASILRALGYSTELVTDFTHVWVKTDQGETMSPRRHKAVVATEHGVRVDYAAALRETLPAIAYGISVFPAVRELIILAVLWYVMLRRRVSRTWALMGLVLLLDGWMLLRLGGRSSAESKVPALCFAAANVVAGLVLLRIRRRGEAGVAATPSDSPAAEHH
jgi:hypothetical protein